MDGCKTARGGEGDRYEIRNGSIGVLPVESFA